MQEETANKIRAHLENVMKRFIQRKCFDEPFDEEVEYQNNPFGFRLVPVEVWKGAKFERSFVTILGQGIFEQIGKILAEGVGAFAENQHITDLRICTWRLEKIDSILTAQRQRGRSHNESPDWNREVREILELRNDRFEDVRVISDLYIRRPDGAEEFYSFKTVKPNLDQTEAAKQDMLRLKAGNPAYLPFFALPYNPAGEKHNYRDCGHSIPFKLFDLQKDECVLIGSSLWNRIGGVETTFDELLSIFEDVGKRFYDVIRHDYFGVN